MMSRTFVQSLLWGFAALIAATACIALTLQVKAVNSDIAATERTILATKQQLILLETEFQTRARQQQLVRWNEVDFGYRAPRADQFVTTGTALAALGQKVLDEEAVLLAAAEDEAFGALAEAPAMRAAVGEAAIRQLAANDPPTAEPAEHRPVAIAAVAAAPTRPVTVPDSARFAEKFDLQAVIASAEDQR